MAWSLHDLGANGSLDMGGDLSSCVSAWGTWHWFWGCTTGLHSHPLPQVVWWLAGVTCFSDGGSPSFAPDRPQIWCLKAVFQGEEARLAPATIPLLVPAVFKWKPQLCSHSSLHCSSGKTSFIFFFLSLLHLWDLSGRSSVFCLILYIVIYW